MSKRSIFNKIEDRLSSRIERYCVPLCVKLGIHYPSSTRSLSSQAQETGSSIARNAAQIAPAA